MHDILIIGAGPAGLAAAIYLLRAEKSVLLLERGAFGGQMTYSPKIENYPGIPSASGNEIADRLVDQVLSMGADIEVEEAVDIEDRGAVKAVRTADGTEYLCRGVILAVGAKHRRLHLPGEEDLIGNGVSFCAVCDGAFYKDRDVVVVGGGNSAKQEALMLAKLCRTVTMVQNLPFLTGEEKLTREVLDCSNIHVIFRKTVEAYLGGETLTGVRIADTETGEKQDIAADGVFVAIGLAPDCGAFSSLIALDDAGYAIADETCLTRTPGLFVAGDCRTKGVRQIATATADGAVAALGAIAYLDRTSG